MKAVVAMLSMPILLAQLLAAGGQPSFAADKRALADLIERTEAANNAGDVPAWVALFSDGAVYMAPGAPPVTTREGLVGVAEAGFRHRASVDLQPVEIQVCGAWAFARIHVTGHVKLHESGKVVPIDVKQVAIYRRNEAGRWQIARLISNSNSQ
jgi:uncharacterized protein (TIGR02246 family)